jgi:uncharacterized protein YkwD
MTRLVLAVLLALAPALAHSACAPPPGAAALLAEARAQINAYRQAAGLGALTDNTTLANTAQTHACDMSRMGRHSHTGSNGSDLAARLRQGGYPFRAANENVGKFNKSRAADWWYGSPGHRKNMLSPKIKEVGLGVVQGADKQFYWVMLGGARR